MKLHISTVEKLKTFNALLEKAYRPTSYDFEKVEAYINGLFSYAKFNVGDKVEMAKTYPVTKEESWGWMSDRHLLVKGSRATVLEVDYRNERFIYLIEFEEASWIDDKDVVHPKKNTTNLYMSESWLTLATPSASKTFIKSIVDTFSPIKERLDEEDKGKSYPAEETKEDEKKCGRCKCGQGN